MKLGHFYKFFYAFVLFLSSFSFMSAQATPTWSDEDRRMLDDFKVFTAYHSQVQDALTLIKNKTARNEVIDWLDIAASLGLPESSADDILARLNNMLAVGNSYLNPIYSMLGPGETLEYCMQSPDPCGKYHTLKTVNGDNEMWNAREAIRLIKEKPGEAVDDPKLLPVLNPNDNNFFDISYMLSALSTQIPALIKFIKALSWICGIFLVMIGMLKLKALGDHRSSNGSGGTLAPALAYLFVGMVLVYFPSMFYALTETLFGIGGGDSVLSYDSNSLTGFAYAELTLIVVAIVRLVGYIAFFRGWLIIVKLGSPNAQHGVLSKGVIHIVGGVLAINIVSTWEVLRATFGYAW